MRNESSEAPRDAAARLPQAARGRPLSFAYLVWSLFAGHTMASMAMLVLPAVAPEIAREYGIDASLIGYQISLVSTGHVLSLLYFWCSVRSALAPATACWGRRPPRC
jgi:hypothetical protein